MNTCIKIFCGSVMLTCIILIGLQIYLVINF
jgi:hypothetical protein